MKRKLIFVMVCVMLFSSLNIHAQSKKERKKKEKATATSTFAPQAPAAAATFQPTILANGDIAEVEAKGVGVTREDALKDALRLCVEQAAGITLSSQTTVENFMVIKDAISTKSDGYITSYSIVKEIPFPDRFEVTVRAKVSTSPT